MDISLVSGHSHKLLLLGLSVIVIAFFSQSWATPLFVLTLLTLNFCTLASSVSRPQVRNMLLWINWIALPLGFYVLQVKGYVGVLGDSYGVTSSNAILLLGLPFYSLSILSLNHEIQTGRIQRPSWTDYVLFGIYFPKFLSGPVEQPALLTKLSAFKFSYNRASLDAGCDWFILGAFSKFIVAYYLSHNVHIQEVKDVPTIAMSVVAFELQVYFDLAGYSFMAYGISKALGIELTLNFNHPFFSGNIQSFWQRWHISLGRWFHQYVHTPFRAKGPKSYWVQLLLPVLVFLLSAVWHGQTLNFLVWGLWHGLAYLIYVRLLRGRHWSTWLALPALLVVLLFGRFLFMEAEFHILLIKLDRLLSLKAWQEGFGIFSLTHSGFAKHVNLDFWVAFVLSAGFLLAEKRNQRLGLPAYAVFHRPATQWLMIALALLLIEGVPKGFIYARQ